MHQAVCSLTEPRAALKQAGSGAGGTGNSTALPPGRGGHTLTFPALLPLPGFCMNLQAGNLSSLKERKGESF